MTEIEKNDVCGRASARTPLGSLRRSPHSLVGCRLQRLTPPHSPPINPFGISILGAFGTSDKAPQSSEQTDAFEMVMVLKGR